MKTRYLIILIIQFILIIVFAVYAFIQQDAATDAIVEAAKERGRADLSANEARRLEVMAEQNLRLAQANMVYCEELRRKMEGKK